MHLGLTTSVLRLSRWEKCHRKSLNWRHGCKCVHICLVDTSYLPVKYEPFHDKTNKMSVRPAKTPPNLIRVFAVRSVDS